MSIAGVNSLIQLFDGRPVNRPTGLSFAAWSIAAAMPWLLPTHAAPWTTFYSELLIALLTLPFVFWVLRAVYARVQVDLVTAGITLFACVPIIQSWFCYFVFPGEAVVVAAYVTGFALMLALAQASEEIESFRLLEALLASLAIAAIISTGMALYQWLQLDSLGLLVAELALGDRAIANVGQPNNLATLLVWGLLAIWWGFSRLRIGHFVAVFAAAFLLVGVALTQSRTGYLAVSLLGAAAVVSRRAMSASPSKGVVALLTSWFALLVIGLAPVSELILGAGTRTLAAQAEAGTRPMIWMMGLDAIAQRPWFGYGWNQSVQAHIALYDRHPDLHETIQFFHNIVLDLMLWNGIPLGLLMVVGGALWLWHQVRGPLTPERLILLLAIGVFVLHAMLELPHALAFFLLPVAVMMGTLNATWKLPTLFTVPRAVVGVVVLLHTTVLALMFHEYRQIETDLTAYRLRAARIGNMVQPPPLDLLVLSSLQDALVSMRIEPRRNMPASELAQMRKTTTRYPSYGNLFRYARASALNERLEDSRWALDVLCTIKGEGDCRNAKRDWDLFTAEGNPELAQVIVPVR